MKENIKRGAMGFIIESDRRDFDSDRFLRARGLVGIPVLPHLGNKSPLFISDGTPYGTVVPRVEHILGEVLGMRVLSKYFTIRNHNFEEPLWRYQILELPEVKRVGTGFDVDDDMKGLIEGLAKPRP